MNALLASSVSLVVLVSFDGAPVELELFKAEPAEWRNEAAEAVARAEEAYTSPADLATVKLVSRRETPGVAPVSSRLPLSLTRRAVEEARARLIIEAAKTVTTDGRSVNVCPSCKAEVVVAESARLALWNQSPTCGGCGATMHYDRPAGTVRRVVYSVAILAKSAPAGTRGRTIATTADKEDAERRANEASANGWNSWIIPAGYIVPELLA